MKSTRSAGRRRHVASVATLCTVTVLAAGCSSDAVDSTASAESSTSDVAEATTASSSETDTASSTAPDDSNDTTRPDPSADTTYLDLYVDQGILYNPFYPDALGGDINYLEPECTKAVTDLASFGAARNGVDAAAVLASLEAVNGDLPSNFPAALDAWQQFIADYSDTYSGPFLPIGQGVFDDATLQQALTDPDVVDMLDAYTSLELTPPNDFLSFLNSACTFGE